MNTQINKHVVLFLLALFMMPLSSMAQDIFAKYDGNQGVTYVNIKPKMFQILAKMDMDTDDPEAKQYLEMVNSITSLKAIVTGEDDISTDITSWVNSRSKVLEELMEVRDDGTVVKFFVKDGKQENIVEELLIFVNGISHKINDTNINKKERKVETVIVSLKGNIDLNKINFDFIGDQVQLKESTANVLSSESKIFKEFKVYPNPSSDLVTIDIPSQFENDINVTVLDSQGKQILSQKIDEKNNTLNVSKWQAGLYLININHNDSRIVKRFVKK